MDYIENVVIKLRRKYGKDELVSYLFNRLEELKKENEKLNTKRVENETYIQELEDLKIKSMKNGGEQWFNKYTEVKEKLRKLNFKYHTLSKQSKL